MGKFYDLREFLLLKDPDRDNVSIHCGEPLSRNSIAEDLVNRYDIAKRSWETYGDKGPPIGSRIITLRSGFGGSAGVVLTLSSYYDGDHFVAVDGSGRKFLVRRNMWWIDIRLA